METRPPRFRRFLFRAGLVVAVPAAGLFLWVLSGAFASARDADCIFVPGAAVWRDRRPSDALEYRLEGALRLWQQRRAPRIVVSGGGEGNYAEAEVMAEWLLTRGVPESAILKETASNTTRENARFSAKLMRDHGIGTALVCTQWFHVPRARMCLAREGITTRAAPCGGNTLTREPWFVAREMAALPVYALGLDSAR